MCFLKPEHRNFTVSVLSRQSLPGILLPLPYLLRVINLKVLTPDLKLFDILNPMLHDTLYPILYNGRFRRSFIKPRLLNHDCGCRSGTLERHPRPHPEALPCKETSYCPGRGSKQPPRAIPYTLNPGPQSSILNPITYASIITQ